MNFILNKHFLIKPSTYINIRFLIIFAYLLVLTCISWFFNGKSFWGVDDANIYMVYMRNLAHGHGFVFNPGQERVEGFTSLLWVLIGAPLYLITDRVEGFLLLLNILVVSYTVFRITQLLDEQFTKQLFSQKSLFFLILIGITPGFIDWTILPLMETGMFCLFITLPLLQIIIYSVTSNKFQHYITLTVLNLLLLICRPESMVWVPIFIILNFCKEYYLTHSFTFSLRKAFPIISLLILAIWVLISWRLNYFGYPFPNTFYAKVSLNWRDNIVQGNKYVFSLFLQKPVIAFIFIQLIVYVLRRSFRIRVNKDFNVYILSVVFFFAILICYYSGGDHFELHRFWMPFIPVFFMLWCIILPKAYFQNKIVLSLILVSVFFSNEYNFKFNMMHQITPITNEFKIAEQGRNTAYKLNILFKSIPQFPSQGVFTAGGSALQYNGITYDLLGLNNTRMAHAQRIKDPKLPKNHASFNKDVFFSLLPDIFWYNNCGFIASTKPLKRSINFNRITFISRIFQKVHLDKRFKENYYFCRISRINSPTIEIFAQKKFISNLDTNLYKVNIIGYE